MIRFLHEFFLAVWGCKRAKACKAVFLAPLFQMAHRCCEIDQVSTWDSYSTVSGGVKISYISSLQKECAVDKVRLAMSGARAITKVNARGLGVAKMAPADLFLFEEV